MIQKLVDKNCQLIFKHPLYYLVVLILLTSFFGYFYATLPTETSIESLLNENDPDLQFYETFKDQFGEDKYIVVGIFANNVFSSEVLEYIQQKTIELENLSGIEKVTSLTNVDDFIGSDFDFIISPLVEKIPTSPEESEKIKARAKNNSLINGALFNRSATAALFYIEPENSPEDKDLDSILIDKIEKIFEHDKGTWDNFEYHLAGWPVTEVNLNRYMSRDMAVFMPATYAILSLALFLVLRNKWLVFITLINITVCVVWTLGILNLIGGAMAPMTSILPPLMMTLAVSDCIHIFAVFKLQVPKKQFTESIRLSLRKLAIPCFLTSLTTAVGFISLSVSQIPRIKHFGIAAALGMTSEFFLTITILPLGLYLIRNKISAKKSVKTQTSPTQSIIVKICHLVRYHDKKIVITTLILCCISLYAFCHINIETNLLDYFKQNSKIYKAADFIDNNLGGAETLEISLKTKNNALIIDTKILQIVNDIEIYLSSLEIVSETVSISKTLKELNKSFHGEDPLYYDLPGSRELSAQYLLLYDADNIEKYLDPEYRWTRISARLTEHSSKNISKLIDKINNQIAKINRLNSTVQIETRLTGKTFFSHKLVGLILTSQISSFALALLLIFITLLILYRSLTMGLISLIPNIIPILFTSTIMVLFNIPLNAATAVIAAVAIGISVDDTIHFMYKYRSEKQKGTPTDRALQISIKEKGVAIILTSIIMICGFLILVTASFIPTIQFGILCSFIMLIAVIADLLILPSIIQLLHK